MNGVKVIEDDVEGRAAECLRSVNEDIEAAFFEITHDKDLALRGFQHHAGLPSGWAI